MIPANIDGSIHPGQGQGPRFCLHCLALGAGQPTPWLDREHVPCAPPCPDRLPGDKQGTRPDTGCPQRPALTLVWHQELAVLEWAGMAVIIASGLIAMKAERRA